ncbi:MAG: hypothetical protein HXX13_14455 [Bacteroidetes bacterium]|nr:hypothetical protein [Bacteroidota bacterium]
MKKSIFAYGIALLSVVTACQKSDDTKPDKIWFEQVNKTITASYPDSISGACKDLVFNINGNLTNGYQAFISQNSVPLICDGGNQFLVDENTNQIKALAENTEVSENGAWTNDTKLYLDQFTGQGEKYIGYRHLSFPSGKSIYYYGWIKIELSANKETLTILNRATNQTEFKNLNTGQIK